MEQSEKPSSEKLIGLSAVLDSEIIIDRPVKAVWPELFNYKTWNPMYAGAKLKKIKGEKNREGEIMSVNKKVAGKFTGEVLTEIILVKPFEKLVWKMYSPNHDGSYVVFVDFSLQDLNGKTRFLYNSYSETFIPESKVTSLPSPSKEDLQPILDNMFQALKTHVEKVTQ